MSKRKGLIFRAKRIAKIMLNKAKRKSISNTHKKMLTTDYKEKVITNQKRDNGTTKVKCVMNL